MFYIWVTSFMSGPLPRGKRENENCNGCEDESSSNHVELQLSCQVEGNQPEEDDKWNSNDDMFLKKTWER